MYDCSSVIIKTKKISYKTISKKGLKIFAFTTGGHKSWAPSCPDGNILYVGA
jgi:hypothetical protein